MHRYIITGGPGAGKTTLVQALQNQNFKVSEEASRQIIRQELAKGSACLPWVKLSCFAPKVLARMVELYQNATPPAEITFFDRGIPDIIAYLQAANEPVDENYYHTLQQHPYHQTVFIIPPWQQIYVNDSERWQTFAEAATLYQVIKETYQSLEYTTVELPKAPVQDRVKFILSHIADHVPSNL
jgi:predicted ATPase